jgi:uncharacterized membrane protein
VDLLSAALAHAATAAAAAAAAFHARLLKAFDFICLCHNIFTYSMLLRTFGLGSSSGMSWHHLLPVATYFILAILQLLVLLLAPNLHQVQSLKAGIPFLS